MDIIDEVLKETAEIRRGIENKTIRTKEFNRPAGIRRQLSTALANQIDPLLATHGFIRKNNCFIRMHGDALLQIIGVVYPENRNFYTASIVQPLYDFFHPLSDTQTGIHNLIGLKNNHCPDDACSIEYTLGVNNRRKILSAQYDYEKPFQAVYLLLEQGIIPRLDSCTTAAECIRYDQYGQFVSYWGAPSTMISLCCRDHMYEECLKHIEICRKIKERAIRKLAEAELRPLSDLDLDNTNVPTGFKEEVTSFYDVWEKGRNRMLQYEYSMKTLLEKLEDLVTRKEERELRRMMNQSIRTEFSYLKKVSKQFAKTYPLQQILHEDD